MALIMKGKPNRGHSQQQIPSRSVRFGYHLRMNGTTKVSL